MILVADVLYILIVLTATDHFLLFTRTVTICFD